MDNDERCLFSQPPRDFFELLLQKTTRDALSKEANISLRTLRAWQAAETSMPAHFAQTWATRYGLDLPAHEIISLREKRVSAGVLGGKAREKIWGNPGTLEGRRLGAKHSIETHRKNLESAFNPRPVAHPEYNTDFAELVGIILGDGAMTPYQCILYSNSLNEPEYAAFLADLVEKVFGVRPVQVYGKEKNVIITISSRVDMIGHLQTAGLGIGDKVKRQADVPLWVKQSDEFSKACLRGLVDTDGCVYLDKHLIKGKKYASLCIAFTNASIPLLDFAEKIWRDMGLTPTRFGRNVRLRRRHDVLQYAKEIGFSNPKHARKIKV
jgi:hypothetical protein